MISRSRPEQGPVTSTGSTRPQRRDRRVAAFHGDAFHGRGAQLMDLKVEAVVVPVSDVDKAKHFYGSVLGWREDADFSFNDGSRIVQMTPPGSACSIHFGAGVASATAASPASVL